MSLQRVLIALVLPPAGCASGSPNVETEAAQSRRCISTTMAAVESAARNQPVQVDVIWVHPPRPKRCMEL